MHVDGVNETWLDKRLVKSEYVARNSVNISTIDISQMNFELKCLFSCLPALFPAVPDDPPPLLTEAWLGGPRLPA